MYYDPAATGERIQNLRKDREVTQEQLAIDLNISDRYMRNLEKGEKVPSVDLFVELRERFGSSLDYISKGRLIRPMGRLIIPELIRLNYALLYQLDLNEWVWRKEAYERYLRYHR